MLCCHEIICKLYLTKHISLCRIFGKLRLCNIWMETYWCQWWKVHSSIMNLNISWTENKELPYSLRATPWMGHSFYCSSAFFSKAIICSLITRKLYWLLSLWPFCIFPRHSLWRGTSVWHHRLQSMENPLLFHVIAEIMDSVLWRVLGCTAAIAHFKAEWRYSLLSMER